MANKVIVKDESIDKAVNWYNGLKNDNEVKKMFDEQPYITSYIMAVVESGGLSKEATQEVLELVFICWSAFSFEHAKIPEIKEGIIEHVLAESENLSNKIIKSLGIDTDDENFEKKVNAINEAISDADSHNPEEFLEFIRKNNLGGLMDEMVKAENLNSQKFLIDFFNHELANTAYNFTSDEINLMQGLLMNVLRCFDLAVNKTPVMNVVKSPAKDSSSSEMNGARHCFQIKITLDGLKPPIWRRLIISDDITLDELHYIIIEAMGWEGYHLYQFSYHKNIYSIPDEDFNMVDYDSSETRLSDLYLPEGSKFNYCYDFGDNWDHTVQIEKILPYDENQKYPVCIKGKRNCPPEDVGGVWGYMNILEILDDKRNPEYNDYLEWLGGPFDPEEFDLDAVNSRLKYLH